MRPKFNYQLQCFESTVECWLKMSLNKNYLCVETNTVLQYSDKTYSYNVAEAIVGDKTIQN